jgi:hypothetical protein
VFDSHGDPVGASPIGALFCSGGLPEVALECRKSLMDDAQLVLEVVREDGRARRDLVRHVALLDCGWTQPRLAAFGAAIVGAATVQRAAPHQRCL